MPILTYGGMQPLVTMARLAPAAAPIRMATQVLLLLLLNAADVAYNVVTLDHICEGRLDLGIGLAYHLQKVELGGITRQDRVPKEVLWCHTSLGMDGVESAGLVGRTFPDLRTLRTREGRSGDQSLPTNAV
jgi:Luciferase-like monooxygenase